MDLRKLILTALPCYSPCGRRQSRSKNCRTSSIDRGCGTVSRGCRFIEASEDLADLDHAFNLWESFAPMIAGVAEARAAEASDEPSPIPAAEPDRGHAIQNQQGERAGFRPSGFCWGLPCPAAHLCCEFFPEELDDPESPFYQQLRESLLLLAHFGKILMGTNSS